MKNGVRIVSCGDAALAVHFDERPSPALARRIAALHESLRARGNSAIESIPGLTSLTVLFAPDSIAAAQIEALVVNGLEHSGEKERPVREWTIPVCYEGALAPDLEYVAGACGLTTAEVVAAHTARAYTVYLLGFSPGFPYMGDLDPRLALPRRSDPRPRVPEGAVAIATGYTAIYPQETAGGWHVIGATPVKLFDPLREPPALLAPGDTVRFEAIPRGEFDRLREGT